MPDAASIQATIERYCALFTAGDKEAWLDLWAPDATMEDPVGTPLKKGRDEIGAFWDEGRAAADSVELRLMGTAVVIGNEAAFAFQARPTLGGQTFAMPVIDVMTFDDDGRIASQRAFVGFDQMSPADG